MNFTGIDQITHGVENLSECVRFYDDWGLTKISANDKMVQRFYYASKMTQSYPPQSKKARPFAMLLGGLKMTPISLVFAN